MASRAGEDRSDPQLSRKDQVAVAAIVVGGLLMAALFIPFTLAHGPTSFNEERVILGLDMHGWGLLLGVLPNLLVGFGLWRRREAIAGSGRAATVVLAIACVAMLMDALANLVFGGLGAPFVLFILAPATLTLAVLTPARGARGVRLRVLLAALGIILAGSVALSLITMETSDSFGGYRIFGSSAYGIAGVLWLLVGTNLRNRGATLSSINRT